MKFCLKVLKAILGNSDELLTQPMGLLLKANIKDIFEDYSLVAGARYPLSFNGSEYFLTFENRKKLIDQENMRFISKISNRSSR